MTSLLARAMRRARGPVREDSGFSLIEAVIALMVATVAFTALAAGAMSAIRGSMTGRSNQQAIDFLAQRIEELRLVDFASLSHQPADIPNGDSAVTTSCGGFCVSPAGDGVQERLVTVTGGAIAAHTTTISGAVSNRTIYTLRTYVTAPVWEQRDYYRRLTTVITWQDGATTRTRRNSTIVAYTQRGLPLPVFKLTPIGSSSQSVNRDTTVVYGFTVNNQGAPDRFDIGVTDSPSTWTWSLFVDDGDGVWDAGDTVALADTDSNGKIDTGRIDPNGSIKIWMVYQVPPTATFGTTVSTVTATSAAQPAEAGGVKTLPFTTSVVNGAVTPTPTSTVTPTPSPTPATDCAGTSATGTAASGRTLRSYTLHNLAATGNSAAQQALTMATTAPYATTLYQYSTDVMASQPGRVLLPSIVGFPSANLPDPQRVADWRYPVGAKAYEGDPAVNLYVASPVGSPVTSVTLMAYVYKYTKTGSTYTATAVATIPLAIGPFSCSGFQRVGASAVMTTIPASGSGALGPNDYMGLRIINIGTSNVRIAYDVLSVYPAAVVLPES